MPCAWMFCAWDLGSSQAFQPRGALGFFDAMISNPLVEPLMILYGPESPMESRCDIPCGSQNRYSCRHLVDREARLYPFLSSNSSMNVFSKLAPNLFSISSDFLSSSFVIFWLNF